MCINFLTHSYLLVLNGVQNDSDMACAFVDAVCASLRYGVDSFENGTLIAEALCNEQIVFAHIEVVLGVCRRAVKHFKNFGASRFRSVFEDSDRFVVFLPRMISRTILTLKGEILIYFATAWGRLSAFVFLAKDFVYFL